MDGMPFVGRLTPDHERTFVATGLRKWGMTNGTAAARIIADAIAGTDDGWAEAFDATRKRPLKSVKDFAKENINVAKHLEELLLRSDEPFGRLHQPLRARSIALLHGLPPWPLDQGRIPFPGLSTMPGTTAVSTVATGFPSFLFPLPTGASTRGGPISFTNTENVSPVFQSGAPCAISVYPW